MWSSIVGKLIHSDGYQSGGGLRGLGWGLPGKQLEGTFWDEGSILSDWDVGYIGIYSIVNFHQKRKFIGAPGWLGE